MVQKRLSVVVSEEAWTVLKEYQEKNKIGTRDEAVETFLLAHRGGELK